MTSITASPRYRITGGVRWHSVSSWRASPPVPSLESSKHDAKRHPHSADDARSVRLGRSNHGMHSGVQHTGVMVHPYWPLFDLEVRTPLVTLRYPDDALMIELATLIGKGIHDPD